MADDTAKAQDFTKATKLDEMDRLRVQVSAEKAGRLQAEQAHLTMLLQRIEQESAALKALQAGLSQEMQKRYSLGPQDSVDLNTGSINRVPAEPAKPKLEAVPPPKE